MKNILLESIKFIIDNIINPKYKSTLAKTICALCNNNSYILDYGCDDGKVSSQMMRFNPTLKIVGIDIQANKKCKIPRKVYDGMRIPYNDNTFDTVISLDVLHHTNCILKHLKELKRVTKQYIIIKDHVVYTNFSNALVSFFDYITNAPYGIKCTFNYPTPERYNRLFRLAGLNLVYTQPFNYSSGIANKYNRIFILSK